METFDSKLGWNCFEYQDYVFQDEVKRHQFLFVYPGRNVDLVMCKR